MTFAVFLVRRCIDLAGTLFVASLAIFGSLAIAPGDPATALAGGRPADPETMQAIREQYHLDDPLWSQYWNWLTSLLSGDLGQSVVKRASVTDLIGARAMNTIELVTYAAVIILVIGIGLGVLAALGGRRVSSAVTFGTTLGMAAPSFAVAIVLIWIFSTRLSWFPVYGSGDGLLDQIRHLTLPAISLAITYIAYVSRITATSVGAELNSEHVDTARSRGVPFARTLRHHVLRNASAPILAVSGLTIAGLFAGTAVAEKAFGISGLGSLLIDSAINQDLAVVQVLAMLMVAAFVIINTVVDLLNAALDPRTAQDHL